MLFRELLCLLALYGLYGKFQRIVRDRGGIFFVIFPLFFKNAIKRIIIRRTAEQDTDGPIGNSAPLPKRFIVKEAETKGS